MNFNSKYKVKNSIKDIETHEVLLDKLAKTKEEEIGVSGKKFEVKIKEKIFYLVFGLFILVASGLFFKTFYLQIFDGEDLYALAESNKTIISLTKPQRGIIYDKNFTKLATNISSHDLLCDKRNFYDFKDIYQKEIIVINEVLEIGQYEIEEKIISSAKTKVVIAENIPHEKLLVLETRKSELQNCHIEENTIRDYVKGEAFSHLLGYMGKINDGELKELQNYTITDYIGRNGLENSYESFLRGIPGELEIVKDAYGTRRGDNLISNPKNGYSLVLNIDEALQNKIYKSLEESIENIGSEKGAAVAINPKTGAVLSLVSYPSFDNNIFGQGASQDELDSLFTNPNNPLFNRIISGQYPVGSTIKPFIAYGALKENIISPRKLINDPGYILVQNQYNPDIVYRFGGVEPHGLVDMREAIAVSSNIYFYTVGGGYENQKGIGPTNIKKYLNSFGWGEKTNIDIPGEVKGFVPSPAWKKEFKGENWSDGDTYNFSIGQSDLRITPLQVAMAYSAVANGGNLYKPQIVKEVVEGNPSLGQIIKQFNPELVKENFLDLADLKVVKEGMRQAVTSGSASMLSGLPVKVAAKTGTAEISREGKYNTWISAFAPYEDPEIVLVVTIEEVEGLRAATLPVAREVLDYYFGENNNQ